MSDEKNEEVTAQQPLGDDDIVALIDPQNQIALQGVLACKRRIDQLQEAQKIQQALLDSHEGRIEQLEALLLTRGGVGGTAN